MTTPAGPSPQGTIDVPPVVLFGLSGNVAVQ